MAWHWTLLMTVSTGPTPGRTTSHLPAWTEPTDTQVTLTQTLGSVFVHFSSCCYQLMCLCACSSVVLTQDIPHIFAMTLFEEYIYWTDWETKSINRAHKTLGINKTMLISTLHRPMDVHIYHAYRQPEGMTCAVYPHQRPGFCLICP